MKYVDVRDLPPCSLSPECLRLIDDLDIPAVARTPARLLHIHDLQDQRQLRQLRSHVPGCPTCSALLAETRRMRTQQRTMLHHYLLANERNVPSATDAIFAALSREQALERETHSMRQDGPYRLELVLTSSASSTDHEPVVGQFSAPPRPPLYRILLQNFLTLATVAAVILAAVGFLNRFMDQASSVAGSQPHPQQPIPPNSAISSAGWDSVVIGLTLLSASGLAKSLTVYSFNSYNNQIEPLISTSSSARLDEVSQDGEALLYSASSPDGQQTDYETFSPPIHQRQFYALDTALAGNAIWLDSEHALVQNIDGALVEVDVLTGSLVSSWPLQTGELVGYQQPFLYFIAPENFVTSALYRIDLAQAQAEPQEITSSSPDTRFWLSPDGTTVFYVNRDSSGDDGIYAVNSDGTDGRILYQGEGLPIGYGADNTLLLLQQVGSKVEVMKLGATPQQPEQVVFSDAAPDGISLCGPEVTVKSIALCDQNIALAPYGGGLLLHVYYANGSHGLVYDDLTTGISQKIWDLPDNTSVQLPGWSRMASSKTSLAAPTTLSA